MLEQSEKATIAYPGDKVCVNKHLICELACGLLAPNQLFSWLSRHQSQQGAAAILCAFEPSAIKLDHPRVSPATSFLQRQNATVINSVLAHVGRD